MKLTIAREQIPLARETVAWLRSTNRDANGRCGHNIGISDESRYLPGHDEWQAAPCTNADDARWADALEAAIAEAEGKDAELPQPGPVSDADERAFWREVFIRTYDGTPNPGHASACADEALARYRAAFGGAK